MTDTRARMAVLVRADVAAHIRAGRLDDDIRRLLRVTTATIRDVRRQSGVGHRLARGFRPRSLEEAFWGSVRHLPDGHLLWVGDVTADGHPYVQVGKHLRSARLTAYRLAHGRAPHGPLLPCCGLDLCVDREHLLDRHARDVLAATLTALYGDTP
ncbi:hypothetical protein ABTX35_18885 [Streptomyces sp. NPDC096080]|uniref:hypothetical protein n=1 Tax=Streptomyces sp. NPDC096080 TaxID=3156693 RepID=UPI0033259EF1